MALCTIQTYSHEWWTSSKKLSDWKRDVVLHNESRIRQLIGCKVTKHTLILVKSENHWSRRWMRWVNALLVHAPTQRIRINEVSNSFTMIRCIIVRNPVWSNMVSWCEGCLRNQCSAHSSVWCCVTTDRKLSRSCLLRYQLMQVIVPQYSYMKMRRGDKCRCNEFKRCQKCPICRNTVHDTCPTSQIRSCCDDSF